VSVNHENQLVLEPPYKTEVDDRLVELEKSMNDGIPGVGTVDGHGKPIIGILTKSITLQFSPGLKDFSVT
jgi:hypothetical protein